jgi:hypothetical protein
MKVGAGTGTVEGVAAGPSVGCMDTVGLPIGLSVGAYVGGTVGTGIGWGDGTALGE